MYKLTHIYKSFADKQVLSDINLTLHSEVVALIGENGAGKTTLLKIYSSKISFSGFYIIKFSFTFYKNVLKLYYGL